LSPAHCRWHGGAAQLTLHGSSGPHQHVPFSQKNEGSSSQLGKQAAPSAIAATIRTTETSAITVAARSAFGSR
jgi:hypothetical protein